MSDVVRMATREDADEIIRLLNLMHSENAMMPLSEECAHEFFERAFEKRGGIIGVIGEKGDIRAMIMLLITHFWYTKDFHLEEVFNFVRPDHRKSNYARDLIAFARECSDKTKLPLMIGVLTNNRMEGKVRLYRRALGYPAGAFFVYGANWTEAEPSNEDFWKTPFPNRPKRRAIGR